VKPACFIVWVSASSGFCECPTFLRLVEHVDDRIPFRIVGAARQHEPRCRERIERELARDEADLAGIDVFGLERRPGLDVEIHAVMAGERGVLDHRDRRVGCAEDLLGKRAELQQPGGERGLRRRRLSEKTNGDETGREPKQRATREHGILPSEH
jgi:hypothetical protein